MNGTDALQDIQDIQTLKHDYCAAVDVWPGREIDFDRVGGLLVDDVVLEMRMGKVKGRDAVLKSLQAMEGAIGSSVHMALTPKIEIDGDRAKGTWYMLVASAPPGSSVTDPQFAIGLYRDGYVRTAAGWKIEYMSTEAVFIPEFLAKAAAARKAANEAA